jgi:hypothetical protein
VSNFVADRPSADPQAAARKLVEIAANTSAVRKASLGRLHTLWPVGQLGFGPGIGVARVRAR